MKTRLLRFVAGALALLCAAGSSAFAQGTSFTYQGRLSDGTGPANGSYDLTFALHSAASGSAQVGALVTHTATPVSDGLFTVTLDFGNQFPGANRWLEIAVRPNGGGGFTTLTPRQPVAAAPYAITAGNLSGALPSANLSGTYVGAVTLNNAGNSFSGNGANLTGLSASQLTGGTVPAAALGNAWKTTGNAGANPTNGAFLGTTDNLPLEFRVNGVRALRIEPTANGRPNIIGGNAANIVAVGVEAATIAGGSLNNIRADASYTTIAGGESNEIGLNSDYATIGGGRFGSIAFEAPYATIGGGAFNEIGTASGYGVIGGGSGNSIDGNSDTSIIAGGSNNGIGRSSRSSAIGGGANNKINGESRWSTIGGGVLNGIGTNSSASVIGGGNYNRILANSASATIAGGNVNEIATDSPAGAIGGGEDNNIAARSSHSTIAGGESNDIGAGADDSTIGGGKDNKIADGSHDATIAGGHLNGIGEKSFGSTIGGGWGNKIAANSTFATIPGGVQNTAANYAFAAGTQAKANHPGSFVWADAHLADFASTADNQFSIRAEGGVRLNSDTSMSFGNQPRQMLNLYSNTFGIGIQSGTLYFRCQNIIPKDGFIWYRGGVHNDGYLQAGVGGSEMMHLVEAGLYVNGTFINSSDRNVKENFKPVDVRDVLDKVAALPLSEWNYKTDTASRHLGPMAQDFYAAFGIGPDDKHITTVDEGGVALAAIQGLNEKVESGKRSAETRLEKLEEREASLRTELMRRDAENAELRNQNQSLERRLEKIEQLLKHEADGGAR